MKINDYKLIKIKLYFYVFILIVAFFIGFFTNVAKESNNLNYLNYNNFISIFLYNFIIVIIWFSFAHVGISIFFIFKFMIDMVLAGKKFFFDERIYFFSSLSHGVCELLIGFIIFSYSIDFYIYLFHLYKTGNSSMLVFRLKKFLKFDFFIILILLLVSAFLEVYVSNRIILFLGG